MRPSSIRRLRRRIVCDQDTGIPKECPDQDEPAGLARGQVRARLADPRVEAVGQATYEL